MCQLKHFFLKKGNCGNNLFSQNSCKAVMKRNTRVNSAETAWAATGQHKGGRLGLVGFTGDAQAREDV